MSVATHSVIHSFFCHPISPFLQKLTIVVLKHHVLTPMLHKNVKEFFCHILPGPTFATSSSLHVQTPGCNTCRLTRLQIVDFRP